MRARVGVMHGRGAVFLGLFVLGGTVSRPLQAEEPSVARYSHAQHKELGVTLTCKACHVTASNGRLRWPGQDHKPCSNAICHASEFRNRDSKLCYACHLSNEPFAPNPLRKTFTGGREFQGQFSHQTHFGLKILKGRTGCGSCHPVQAGQSRPVKKGWLAPSHALCASCHQALNLPNMSDCVGCHAQTKAEGVSTLDGMWRVVAKFKHDDHREDILTAKPLGTMGRGWVKYDRSTAQDADCSDCHQQVAEAPGAVPRPAKASCEPCHNGDHSFKVTGFDCAKCHGPAN